MLHLVDQQREQDRRRESKQKIQSAQHQRIFDQTPEIFALDEALKMPQPHPIHSLSKKRGAWHIILKRDDQSEHRAIAENNDQDKNRKHQQVQLYVFPYHSRIGGLFFLSFFFVTLDPLYSFSVVVILIL